MKKKISFNYYKDLLQAIPEVSLEEVLYNLERIHTVEYEVEEVHFYKLSDKLEKKQQTILTHLGIELPQKLNARLNPP